MRANKLVREANDMAREMGREIDCSVTLQIPAANLSPNRKVGVLPSSCVTHKMSRRVTY